MAKTIRTGALISGSGLGGGLSDPIHSNAGRVIALLITHTGAAAVTVTLYDATSLPAAGSELAQFELSTTQTTLHVQFPRDEAIPFSTGLCVAVPANCELLLWSVDYG